MSNMLDLSAAQPRALPGSTAAAQAGWVLLFAAATAAGSRLEIPHVPVPFTLQTLAVLLAGAFLGARNGAFSQAAYLPCRRAGLPVFAGGSWGASAPSGTNGRISPRIPSGGPGGGAFDRPVPYAGVVRDLHGRPDCSWSSFLGRSNCMQRRCGILAQRSLRAF